jgi:protein-S-isoprenylcysteine O-methyltransferase Ste14
MIIGIAVALVALAIFRFRRTLLWIDFGFSPLLAGLAAVFIVGAVAIGFNVWKQIAISTLIGRPELSSKRHPGKLVTEGIYARIRHPRYVEGALGILGCTLFANYLGLYIAFLICLPILYLVVILEDRELAKRFGTSFEEYSRNVPNFSKA